MNCPEIRDNMAEYMDGELDALTESGIRDHLVRCGECRAEYERMDSGWKALEAWQDSVPPEGVRSNILRSVRQGRPFSGRMIAALAASLLIIFGMTVYYGGRALISKDGQYAGYAAVNNINEDELIANLDMLEDDDFYDALDELVRFDMLLYDESSMKEMTETLNG